MRKSILIILGLTLGAFALAYSLLHSYLQPAYMVVARYDLAAGTRLNADLLQLRELPEAALPRDALRSLEQAEGQVLSVARTAGDPITAYLVGDAEASAGLPALLAPEHVALGVQVDQATGLIGTLRPGQSVTVIAILDPQVLSLSIGLSASSLPQPAAQLPLLSEGTAVAEAPEGEADALATATPTPSPEAPLSPLAHLSLSGLKVLVVPQAFRYEELPPQGAGEALLGGAAFASGGQQEGVILLQAPLAPIQVTEDLAVSPAVLLALLNEVATIHLALEPAAGLPVDLHSDLPAIALGQLFEALRRPAGE
jgi:hypothetical protein